jgi:hypothetical protein
MIPLVSHKSYSDTNTFIESEMNFEYKVQNIESIDNSNNYMLNSISIFPNPNEGNFVFKIQFL